MIKSKKAEIMESTLLKIIIGAAFLAVAIGIYWIYRNEINAIIATTFLPF